ncbi:MAG: alpha/beta fold hydrolase [bacterium]|nr:alpha/beta fold hydrolase [bacterium]
MAVPRERRVDTLRGEVHPRVLVAGEGPPVVFLHGAMGLMWDQFLDRLAERHTVYAPDHPGTTPGEPDAINSVDSLWELVLHYYDLFDQLELDRPDVIGHSFGGMVAAELAATNPDRVGKLVLISPVGLWRDDAPVAQFMTMSQEELMDIVFADPKGPVAQQLFAAPESQKAMEDALIHSAWSQACTGKFMWPLPDKGLRKRLYRVRSSTLVVWGNEDRLAPPVYAEEFASRIAHAKVARFDAAAHLPHLEQLDGVSRAVLDFLG